MKGGDSLATVDNSISLHNETNSNYMQLHNETNNNYLRLSNSINNNYLRLSNSINNTSTRLYNTVNNNISNNISNFYVMEQYIIDASAAQQDLNEDIEEGQNAADGLLNIFKGMAGTIGLDFSVENILALSDQMATTKANLASMADEFNTVEGLQQKIFQSAERSRGSYLATADAVARMGTMAKNAFGSNDEIIAFTEEINKQFVISGTSAQGINSVMSQLTEAMAQGVLSGDALNSVFGETPTIVQTIADYMGLGIEEVSRLADEGQITANVLKNAMFSATDETNAALANMPMTWGQIFTSVINKVIMVSQPLLDFINVLANNWSIIEPIIWGIVAALAIYTGAVLANNIAQGISTAIQTAKAISIAVKTGATIAETAATNNLTVAQWALNNAMLASPITWIIIGIITIIAVIYAAVAAFNKFAGTSLSAAGIIVGAIAVAGALIWNIIVGVINAVIQYLWTRFVEPFISIIEWIINVANGGFDSLGGAVANLVGQIISWFLSLGKVVTKIIDAIFGTDWTSGLSSLQDSVLGWGKNDNAITLDRNAPTIDGRIEYSVAWDTGYDWGSKLSLTGGLGELDPQGYEEFKGFELPEGIGEGIDEIASNTTDMRNTMEISEEDLKYMRDLAEREVIDRTVLRDVKLEVSNSFGDVRETADVDGIITRIEERLSEAIESEAEGDYNV